jgi:hypothetical protein
MALAPIVPQLHMRQSSRLRMSRQSQPQGEKRYVREKEAGSLRDVAPPMRDPFGEVACLDSQPPLPPCDSALMRVAAYLFVFFIYENSFPGSKNMHIDPHNFISAINLKLECTRGLYNFGDDRSKGCHGVGLRIHPSVPALASAR